MGARVCSLQLSGSVLSSRSRLALACSGDGSTVSKSSIPAASAATNVQVAIAGGNMTCYIRVSGAPCHRKVQVTMASICVHSFHVPCVLMACTANYRCWGQNTYGGLGTGSTTDLATPPNQLNSLPSVTQASAGAYHGCIVSSSGLYQIFDSPLAWVMKSCDGAPRPSV